MAQLVYTRVVYKEAKLNERERLLMFEIGKDRIDSASSFVNYVYEVYGFSKSSVWYNLNRLKELGILDFANKDEVGKPLCLTRAGLNEMNEITLGNRGDGRHANGADVML